MKKKIFFRSDLFLFVDRIWEIKRVVNVKKIRTVLTDEDLKALKINTQYTEEEIQAWHSGFLKDCPSGKLDKKQFLNVYKVCI